MATRAATAISSSFPAWALWLPLVAAAALGCDDTTGVYLHIEAVDVVADHLRVTATSAAGSVTRELDAGGGGTLRFPASLLAKFPAGVGAVGFVVVASRGGVDAATGSLAAARVPPHQVVDRTLRLGGGGGGGDGGMVTAPSYTRTLTVPRGRVLSMDGSMTLADYPVLVSLKDATLRSIANGGHVARDDGSDLYFTADGATCGTPAVAGCILDHEVERYDGGAGVLVAWVRVPALKMSPASNDTVFTVHYGNGDDLPTIAPLRVWDASFRAVWHLPAAAAVADSTSGGHAGRAVAVAATEARIGAGLAFDGAASYVEVDDADALDARAAADFTVSLWVRSTQPGGGAGPRLVSKRDAAGPGYEVSLHGSGDLWAGQVAGATSATLAPGRTNVADGNWHLLTLVRRDLSLTAYEDGTPAAAQMSAAEDDAANALALRLGAAAGPTPVQFFAGQLDEVRVSAGARSFDWILADFNSQSSPATFVLVGAEVAP